VRDAEQPARETPRRIERRETAIRLDEGLLRKVLRERAVACHPADETDDRPLIPADDLFKGRLRSRKGLGNQAGLADCLEIDRDDPALT
jgi:hypothetical protein